MRARNMREISLNLVRLDRILMNDGAELKINQEEK